MDGLKHVKAIVTNRRDITPELWIVRVRAKQTISFLPGQFVTVGLPAGERLVERPYSVASSPADSELEFFLEVVPEGKLTPHLYQVPEGGEVYIRPEAKGRFTFDGQSGRRNHFMVATVTGVAPFVSMVRSMVLQDYRVKILQSAGVSPELGYWKELSALAARHEWLEYIPTVSRPWLDPGWRGERGRAEDVARKHLDSQGFSPGTTTAYLCGNPHMILNMKGVLERAGFQKESIRTETYWPAE